MDAQAEGRMPVRRAIELDLLRLVEQLRGQVGRRPRDPDPVVLTQRLAIELTVSRDGPRHTLHWRHPPEVLLARQRQPTEVLDQEPAACPVLGLSADTTELRPWRTGSA